MNTFFLIVFASSLLMIVYHHIIYPYLLRLLASRHPQPKMLNKKKFHSFVFVIPVYNEADYIEQKIANLAALEYPKDQYKVLILDDASVDNTRELAKLAASKYPELDIDIDTFSVNQGKVARLNHAISQLSDDCIIFFSDASARLSKNVLKRANAYFHNPKIAAFCTKYKFRKNRLIGEQYYWDYQCKIKQNESKLGSPMGYHGAGYAMRCSLWEKLPDDAINDDFIMPLKAIEKGFQGVYDNKSFAIEDETSSLHLNWNRRIRIARGNIQQVAYLLKLLSPHHGYISWMFFSGKVLRIMMTWFFILLFISNSFLATQYPTIFLPLLIIQLLFYCAGALSFFIETKPTDIMAYFIQGHAASMIGWFSIVKKNNKKIYFIHPIVRIGKWIMDKIGAILGLTIMIFLLPFIALMIKTSSPGPVFFKQIRVGKGTEKETKLFYLYKFRTMHMNSEKKDFHYWTKTNDARVFDFGRWLRKTHLDELPQFFNILKGDMSLVGPRPEQPSVYPILEQKIPLYEERLFHILPGLTGLAQITYRYDQSFSDVKKKVAVDHTYATRLANPITWFKTDMLILIKTIGLVLAGKGH